jgi:hypothetical protein
MQRYLDIPGNAAFVLNGKRSRRNLISLVDAVRRLWSSGDCDR